MNTSSTRRRRVAGVLAALAAAASISVVSGSNTAIAAAPGTPASAPVTITPATGNSSTAFKLAINGADTFCGGTGPNGWFWHTFITPLSQDPAVTDFVSGTPQGPALTTFLRTTGAGQIRNQPPGDPDGFVNLNSPTFNFAGSAFASVPPGSYHIGAACENPAAPGETAEYWSTIITITAAAGAGTNNFTYQQGLPLAVPSAPTLSSVAPGSGQITASFSAVTANPAVTDYTVTATDGTNTFTQTGPASPITVTGLQNGTAYNVTVVANNTQGPSVPSNMLSATPSAGAQPAPTALTAVPGAVAGDINVSWVAPAGVAPSGYSLAVTPVNPADPAVAASPFAIAAGATSFTVPALPSGVLYDFTLTATYADPSAVATPASVQAAAASAQTLQQEIQVERPNGALILTQRCGVNNALAAEAAVNAFPGFPAVGAIAATADQTGTTPDIDVLTPAVDPDPEFGDYPFANPATYPTKCIIDLGTADLLTTGALAGQYYAADGALNEVTVVDTREGDLGWTVTGSIPSLSNGGLNPDDSFSGNLVGWTPVVSSTSDPVVAGAYDQIVAAGSAVLPGTPAGLASPTGQVLADADPTEGLGIAVLDARIKVLIPVSNANGIYEGILTLNAG